MKILRLQLTLHIYLENLHLFFVSLCSKMPAWRRRTAEFAVALAVPTEGPKILGCTKKNT